MVGVYNRNLADHPKEPGSVGGYNRNLADHPMNQDQLGFTIGALADHPNELGSVGVGVYNRSPSGLGEGRGVLKNVTSWISP